MSISFFSRSRIVAANLVTFALLFSATSRAGETAPAPLPPSAVQAAATPLPPPSPPAPGTSTTTTPVSTTPTPAMTTLAVAPDRSSDAPIDSREPDTRFSGTALVAYGSDNLNFGIGARFGKTLSNRVYLGGTFVYHFGDSQTVTTPVGNASSSFSVFYAGPEGGYDFVVGPTIIRPYVGLGLASLNTSVSGPGASASAGDTKFVIWPGGTVIYDIKDSAWFIGGDVRLVTVPGGPSFGIAAFGGLHFGS